jgi:chemotaxis protein methyltransferase CheR
MRAHKSGFHAHESGFHAHESGFHAHKSGFHAHKSGFHAHESGIRAHEFQRLQRLIESSAGIFVTHPTLLVQRLTARLEIAGCTSFGAYCDRVEVDDDERACMVECVCTHETRFFREPRQMKLLETELCSAWRARAEAAERPRILRAWSAGCATGEEPYSIAMVLLSELPGFSVDVLATDLSRSALARAAQGVWSVERASEIPEPYLQRFMLEGHGTHAGRMCATAKLRSVVRTQIQNLHDGKYAVQGPFDLIFCRNVLIYFRETERLRVVERLLRHLAPDGYLFLGHAEGLASHLASVRAVGPIVYTHRGSPA